MVDIEKLRGLLARAKSKSDHPEDVASARYQLKEWSMSADLPALLDELEVARLDVQANEALQDGAYKAGLAAGWNFAQDDDEAGFQRARSSTEHVAELKRIRDARAALKGTPQ